MKDPDVCCGFGGTFSVKYGEISDAIVTKKVDNITAADAGTLLAGDLGSTTVLWGWVAALVLAALGLWAGVRAIRKSS